MSTEKVLPVVVSVVIIVLVAAVQERSRDLAAILAVIPLTVPLAAWIVFSASGGDYQQTAQFVGSLIVASAGTVIFVIACWYALRQQWPFPLTIVFAFAAWGVIVALPHLLRRIR